VFQLLRQNSVLTGFAFLQTIAGSVYGSRIGIIFADFQNKRRSWDVDAVEFDVDVVDTVLSRNESDRIDVGVYGRDEAVVLHSRRRHDLSIKHTARLARQSQSMEIAAKNEHEKNVFIGHVLTLASKSPLAPFLRTMNACGLLTWQPVSGNWPISIL
jgi:hypothetical protein